MLQLSIREFNKNISANLKKLPFELTNRGVVIARVSVPNGVPMPAPAKFVNIKKEDVEKGIEVDKKKAKEAIVATPPKNAGERSSDTPSDSATPPPKTAGAFPGVNPIPKPNAETVTIPKLRKSLCPKHSVFSCGCPEKEKPTGVEYGKK